VLPGGLGYRHSIPAPGEGQQVCAVPRHTVYFSVRGSNRYTNSPLHPFRRFWVYGPAGNFKPHFGSYINYYLDLIAYPMDSAYGKGLPGRILYSPRGRGYGRKAPGIAGVFLTL